ncbi:Outer membrane porin protein 32 [Cupriavidus laharis]|uniref:Outer membrane porin protein 32 n=1 Tax=Cupriavidus laharis TaxID=151654 RepID=A0ABN7ZEN9_9BURK|nr:porin [Cupriavidus laharis]CAG9183668.1 Outer membrane porin protein 32 [Cupriavidus laharis]
MKKSAIVLAAGSLLAGSAFAQTSVTLYGIADVSLRYTNNADAGNHSQTQLTDGAVTQSRWGLKGSEALGNNLKAIFQLENGYSVDNGTMNSSGQLFNRQAYVGLAGDFGAVKLGRQYTEGFNFFGDYDPLTIGNYTANAWPFFLTQFRANNVVSYGGKFGGLNVGASYGFGERPGSFTHAQTNPPNGNAPYFGARAAYEVGPFGFGGVYQEIRDTNGNKQQMWGAAGKYSIGPAKIFLGYVGGKDRTGVIDNSFMNASAASTTPAAKTLIAGGAQSNPRKDNLGYIGVTYQATPALALTGVFYGDHIENKNGTTSSGNRYTGVLLAEYSLSKRTQVYGTVDYNKLTGAAQTELPGKNNQTGVAAGIRHIF